MNVTESSQSFVIIEKLSDMREDGEFCDVEFVMKGHVFRAHRNVLASISPYFSASFKKHRAIKEKVRVKDCKSPDALQTFLNYMYSGAMVIDWRNVAGLMALAHQFQMDKISEYCKEYLRDHLNVTNCLFVRDLSVKYDLTELELDTTDFIRYYIAQVFEQEEILRYSAKKLKRFLSEWDSIQGMEFDKLKLICKWVNRGNEKRVTHFSDLLALIDWQDISSAMLEENLNNFALLERNGKCRLTLLDCLRHNDMKLTESAEIFLGNEIDSNLSAEDSNGRFDMAPLPRSLSPVLTDYSDSEIKEQKQEQKLAAELAESVEPIKNKRSRKSNNPQKFTAPLRRSYNTRSSALQAAEEEEYIYSDTSSDEYGGENLSGDESDTESINNDTDVAVKSDLKSDAGTMKLRKRLEDAKTWREAKKCGKCPFATRKKEKYQRHLALVHATDAKYKCRMCDFLWTWIGEYNEHLKTHFNEPYKCPECEYCVPRMHDFSMHLFTHSDTQPFKCAQCESCYCSPKQLYDHILEIHGIPDLLTKRPPRGSGVKKDFAAAVRCDKCPFASHSVERLWHHISTFHGKNKKYKCRDCDFTWSWTGEYNTHLKTHYKGPPFKCKDCNYVSGKIARFANHIFRHSNNFQFECDKCGRSYKSLVLLLAHQRKCDADEDMGDGDGMDVTRKRRFRGLQCDRCPFAAENIKKLDHHISSCHPTNERHKCPECDYLWRHLSDYNMHLKSHFRGPPFQCRKCSYNTDKFYCLAKHLFVHAKDSKFACGQCGQFYGSPQLLYSHVKRQHPLETPYACDQCDRKFGAKSMLMVHKQSHSQEKKHVCDICGYRTRWNRNLFAHKLLHKERKFRCDYPGCKYRTIFESILLRHKRKHTGERPYICSYCGKNYPTKSYLSQHEQIHLNVRYHCEECGSTFAMKKGLRRHTISCHGNGTASRKSAHPRKSRLVRVCEEPEEQPSCSQSVIVRPTVANQMDNSYTTWSDSHHNQQPFPQENVAPMCFGHMPPVPGQHMKTAGEYVPMGHGPGGQIPPRPPPNVPTISHEIPTQFRSFMTFF